jgi:hypothetical protein
MKLPARLATIGLAGVTAAPLAGAVEASIDSFVASSTRVAVGTTVDFTVLYSARTQSWRSGGSNPHEPAPVDGYQDWFVNWYDYYDETLKDVSLSALDQSFVDYPAAAPGASHTGSWSFSAAFQTRGVFEVSVAGSWSADISISQGSEEAYRNCWYDDWDNPVQLRCDAWTWSYPQYDDGYTESGALGPRSLTIVVTAVPEPASAALWLAGLGLLGAAVRAARRA